MILPDTTEEGALAVAEKTLHSITDLNIPHAASEIAGHVSLSIGVATVYPKEGDLDEQLVRAADQALYLAKENGRNRIEVAAPPSGLKTASL